MAEQVLGAVRSGEAAGRVDAERIAYARVAGVALLFTVTAVLTWHLGPGIIAGQRVTGTSDVAAIAAFYSHPSMRIFWWLGSFSLAGILLFAVSFRLYLRAVTGDRIARLMADLGMAAAVAAVPVYALSTGFESALVQLAAAGADGRAALLGIFAAWDWTYNSFAYFLEATYMAAWAVAAWRSRGLPRWIAIVGGVTAAGHLFNSQALLNGLPDNLTLVPTALFFVFFVSTGIYLARGGASTTK